MCAYTVATCGPLSPTFPLGPGAPTSPGGPGGPAVSIGPAGLNYSKYNKFYLYNIKN